MTFDRLDVSFSSQGLNCAAWLYLPDGVERPPVVVMAHGFAGTRTLWLAQYAERFVQRGLAVLVFDYRHFGDSEGHPRQLISVRKQLADWRAAVAHVRGVPRVDGRRIALWGTSFSGGHVIVTAARERDVRAVVAQVPFVDARASLRTLGLRSVARALAAGLRDLGRMLVGRSPYYVPVVAPPGSFAALNTPGCYEAFQTLAPPELSWRNEVAARVLVTLSSYRPTTWAATVRCPLMLIPARYDNLIPVAAVKQVAAKAPQATLRVVDAAHFDVYSGALFDEMVTLEADFLSDHLRGDRTPSS